MQRKTTANEEDDDYDEFGDYSEKPCGVGGHTAYMDVKYVGDYGRRKKEASREETELLNSSYAGKYNLVEKEEDDEWKLLFHLED